MKQLKFIKNISLEGKPIWYKNCLYTVQAEDEGRYKLMSEDLIARGIEKKLENIFYIIIEDSIKEVENKKIENIESKEEIKIDDFKQKKISKKAKNSKKTTSED